MSRTKKIIAILLLCALLAGAAPGLQNEALAAGVSSDFLSACSSYYRNGAYYANLAAVNLTGNQAADVVAVAASQIGYHEGSSRKDLSGGNGETGVAYTGNYTEYGRWFFNNNAPYAWCNLFVAWCIRAAGVGESIATQNPFDIDGWRAIGGNIYSWKDVREGKIVPTTGDLILYSNTCSAWKKSSSLIRTSHHIGICSWSEGSSTIHTIEGNTSYAGKQGYVASKSRNADPETGWVYGSTYIYAIIRPNYNGAGISAGSGGGNGRSVGSSGNGGSESTAGSGLSTLRIEEAESPSGVLHSGQSFGLRGKIISNFRLNKVVGMVLDPAGKAVMSVTGWPSSLTYDLASSVINEQLLFGTLQPGSYWYVVTATDSSGEERDLVWSGFVVDEPSRFTLTLDPNDGNETVEQSFTYAAGEAISLMVPEQAGFVFRCWRNEDTGVEYNPGDPIPADWLDTVLTAQWDVAPSNSGNGRQVFGNRS